MKERFDSSELAPAKSDVRMAYRESLSRLRTRKSHRCGILGITDTGNGWVVNFPWYTKLKPEKYWSPVQACARYNQVMMKLFGEEAVLCDPLAAAKLKEYPEAVRGRPRTTT